MIGWTLIITVVTIVSSVLVSIFYSARKRDRCLMDFRKQIINIDMAGKKHLEGRLELENNGIELILSDGPSRAFGGAKSFLIYKEEYQKLIRILRRYDSMDSPQKRLRDSALKKSYFNNLRRKKSRQLRNLFNTFRDSFMDALNIFIGRFGKTASLPGGLSGGDKHLLSMKQEVLGSFNRAYDPMLERCIGLKVRAIEAGGEKLNEHTGILKEYTPNFLEIMDIDFPSLGKADVIFPRSTTTVRFILRQ